LIGYGPGMSTILLLFKQIKGIKQILELVFVIFLSGCESFTIIYIMDKESNKESQKLVKDK